MLNSQKPWHLTQMLWRCCFPSRRPAHSVLRGGRRQRIVLSAVAGDPPQSLHLPAEQSLKTGGELRTDREGLLSGTLISRLCGNDILSLCSFPEMSSFIAESRKNHMWQEAFLLLLKHGISQKLCFWKIRLATSLQWNNVWKPVKVQNCVCVCVCFCELHQQVELVFCEVGLCGSASQTQEAAE